MGDVPPRVAVRCGEENAFRYEQIQRARRTLFGTRDDGEPAGNKTDAVVKSCIYLHEHERALKRAVEHPDMTEELAEILSHGLLPVEYEVKTSVGNDE